MFGYTESVDDFVFVLRKIDEKCILASLGAMMSWTIRVMSFMAAKLFRRNIRKTVPEYHENSDRSRSNSGQAEPANPHGVKSPFIICGIIKIRNHSETFLASDTTFEKFNVPLVTPFPS